ncbi:MAG: hypothetical protein LBV72_12520 [Tannerella sp.]|jgi:hypothetical protein|nr:hypothetical protein [Tannerella sp.]
MKALKFLAVFLTCIFFLLACKTRKEIVYEQKRDSVYIQRLVPITLPADTARVKALLECNAQGRVIANQLEIETTRNMQLTFLLDSIGNLRVQTIIDYDTIYIPSDSIYIKSVYTEFINIPVEVPLSRWESFLLKFGRAAFWIVAGLIIFGLIYLFIKIKKK